MERLHRPYLLGAKWPLKDLNPLGPIDCSGLVSWCYWRAGIEIPDGSVNQYEATEDTKAPLCGDLGFFFKEIVDPAGNIIKKINHVGIYYGANVIEARGDDYNQVILRPSAKWEAFSGFTGWRRFKGLVN